MELLAQIRNTFKQGNAMLNQILYLSELCGMQETETVLLDAKKKQIKKVPPTGKNDGPTPQSRKVHGGKGGENEGGAKNEEEMEADFEEMRVLLDETEEKAKSLEVTTIGIATMARLQRFNALQNLLSLANTFARYADVMDAEVAGRRR
mmetsp:Transcript_8876/g.16306  ORF Transcript_8876/g.16306 Transcript_8876/m.16306 type:complete len:149 (-) Transcript_8876:281-727(-)